MASYYDEMGWRPLEDNEQPDHLLHLARLLRDFAMFSELGEDKRLPPPASKAIVDNLPETTVQSDDVQCTICLKNFEVGEKSKDLPCEHQFHSACILPWLGKTNSCPLCRYELPTDDETYEEYRKEKIRAKQREQDIETLHNSMFS